MAARQDPLRNFRYRLEIDGIDQAGFSEVAIGDAVATTRSNIARATSSPPSASSTASTSTPTSRSSGASPTPSSWPNWHQLVVDDATPLARRAAHRRHPHPGRGRRGQGGLRDHQAWPSKYDPTDLNGKGNEVAIDSLELVQRGHPAASSEREEQSPWCSRPKSNSPCRRAISTTTACCTATA